jgi:hypothetical protein
VVATLRVADYIHAGKTGVREIAEACGAHAESLDRVMRHLVSKGVFDEQAPGRYALNDTSRPLLDDIFRIVLNVDGFGGRMAYAWGTLLAAVRTGKPAYHQVFGRDFWSDLEANPDVAADFDVLMGPGHGSPDPEVLVDPADWISVQTVVDVGGGTGMLLAEILRTRPQVRGILVDLPRTVARSADVFASAGVADRATPMGQSFFDALPARHDLYILKNLLADWPDAEAEQILKRCSDAARPAGRVVIIGGITPDERASPELMMMVLVGGRGRTLAEFHSLAMRAGLRVRASGRQRSGRFLVECCLA